MVDIITSDDNPPTRHINPIPEAFFDLQRWNLVVDPYHDLDEEEVEREDFRHRVSEAKTKRAMKNVGR